MPQNVNLNIGEDVKLYFRVGQVYKNAFISVKYNGNEIQRRKRPRLAPGEMENVLLKKADLDGFEEGGEISISVEV